MIKLDEDNKNNSKVKFFGMKNDHPHINYIHIERFMEQKEKGNSIQILIIL